MRKEEKKQLIDTIKSLIENSKHFYITDISGLNAADTYELRKKCFDKQIKLVTVKNTLLKLALEQLEQDFKEFYPILKGPTAIILSDVGNQPAKVIREFRRTKDRPILKAAFVNEDVYIGDEEITALSNIKSKEELIADVLGLVQSPMSNLIAALNSGKKNIMGVLKTIKEKK